VLKVLRVTTSSNKEPLFLGVAGCPANNQLKITSLGYHHPKQAGSFSKT